MAVYSEWWFSIVMLIYQRDPKGNLGAISISDKTKHFMLGALDIWDILGLYWLYRFWVNYKDLTTTSLEWWWIRGIIPIWPYFRFVNYYDLPRLMVNTSGVNVLHKIDYNIDGKYNKIDVDNIHLPSIALVSYHKQFHNDHYSFIH